MTAVQCVIQAASPADAARAELERRLTALHADRDPDDDVTITWRAIPDGFMFTEGRPSTSSIISCALEHPTTLTEREAYMRAVCDLWTDVTGCTDHEIVVAITPPERTET